MLWMIRAGESWKIQMATGEDTPVGETVFLLDICYARTNNRRKKKNNDCFYKGGIRLRNADRASTLVGKRWNSLFIFMNND